MNLKEWIHFNYLLRQRVFKNEDINKYLLTSFSGTEQKKDIENRTNLINDFCRVKINIKAFSSEERAKKGLPSLDFSDNETVFRAMRDEFDMPYWAFCRIHVPLKDLRDTFIYQMKGCNIHCPWCYVDDKSKNASEVGGAFFSMSEIIDVFQKAQRQNPPLYNFRPSGGEVTIAIEQWLECLEELEFRGIKAYVQADTNLMTGSFLRDLSKDRFGKHNVSDYVGEHAVLGILHKISQYRNFGLLCSFKGTDQESFLKAIGMSEKFAFLEQERWLSFSNYVDAGIDAYPFIYDPNPATLEKFMEKGARLFGEGFYLKTWVSQLKLYGPEKERLLRKGIDPVDYQKELDEKFRQSEEIMQNLISKKFGLNYKAVPRTGIDLKVNHKSIYD